MLGSFQHGSIVFGFHSVLSHVFGFSNYTPKKANTNDQMYAIGQRWHVMLNGLSDGNGVYASQDKAEELPLGYAASRRFRESPTIWVIYMLWL